MSLEIYFGAGWQRSRPFNNSRNQEAVRWLMAGRRPSALAQRRSEASTRLRRLRPTSGKRLPILANYETIDLRAYGTEFYILYRLSPDRPSWGSSRSNRTFKFNFRALNDG
jgi:hypothetical protein